MIWDHWSPSLPYFCKRSTHWAPLDPLKARPSASRSPAAGRPENCFFPPTPKMMNLQKCGKYKITTLTLPSFYFISCKMLTYLIAVLYNLVHDDFISGWLKMSGKQEFIILWSKCFYQVMCYLKWTWDTCVLPCPNLSNRQRQSKSAAEVWTCRCPSRSGLLQQRVKGSRQHILAFTSANSGEQENQMDQSVLSLTQVWVQQSYMTKHNVPGKTKQNKTKTMRKVLPESLLCNLKHEVKHVLLAAWFTNCV